MADDTGRKLSDLDGDSTDDTEFLGARDLTSWPTSWGHGLASSAVAAAAGARRYLDGRSVPYVVLLVTTMIGVVVAGVLTALSAQIYDNVADRDGVAGLDRPVLDQMIRWRSPGLDDVVTVFTDLGSTAVM
ncbi:MAG: phosphatidic acid phosphatase, partial [Propionibacteriales bacterium]|nr:phosphatidic acid phosphatase [Propionibacteriales bacterium]